MIVTNHLMRLFQLLFFTKYGLDAALHTGKDLAVSPLVLPRELFLDFHPGISRLSHTRASLLAPLRLLATGVTRYLAP
jgi:hypothetical protein